MKKANLPKYKCHRVVGAVKIKKIVGDMKGGATLIPAVDKKSKIKPLYVSHNFMNTYNPKVDDYYAVNADGSVSVHNGKTFEKDFELVVAEKEKKKKSTKKKSTK